MSTPFAPATPAAPLPAAVFASPVPEALTAAALHKHSLSHHSTLSLSGDTPVPTPPHSSYDGDTQVGTRPPSPTGCRGDKLDEKKVDDEEGVEEPVNLAAPQAYPEGGLRANLVVVGAVLVLFSTFGFSNSFAVFMAEYKANQLKTYDTSMISWIGSVHLFICFGSSLVSGMLFDKGFFQYQLAIGSFGWIFGMFMLSLSSTFWQIFLSHSICLGLSVGIMFGPVLSCIGTYFFARRALLIGTAAAGAGMGTVVLSIMLNHLFGRIGFGGAVRAVAYVMAGLLLVANLIMRPRVFADKKPSLATLPLLRKFSKEPSMWLTSLGIFAVVIGVFIVMFFVQVFAKANLSNQTLASYSLSILNASACVGRILVGYFADKFGVFNTTIPIAGLLTVMIFVMLTATNTTAFLVFLLIFGLAAGAFISVMASCFMVLADNVLEIGLRSGVGFFFVALAALIGSPIAGAILKAAGGLYWPAIVFSGGNGVIGIALLVAARRTQILHKESSKV